MAINFIKVLGRKLDLAFEKHPIQTILYLFAIAILLFLVFSVLMNPIFPEWVRIAYFLFWGTYNVFAGVKISSYVIDRFSK